MPKETRVGRSANISFFPEVKFPKILKNVLNMKKIIWKFWKKITKYAEFLEMKKKSLGSAGKNRVGQMTLTK